MRFFLRHELGSAVGVADIAVEFRRVEEHQVEHIALFNTAGDVAGVDQSHAVVVGLAEFVGKDGIRRELTAGCKVGGNTFYPCAQRRIRRCLDQDDVDRFLPIVVGIGEIGNRDTFGSVQPRERLGIAFGQSGFIAVFHAVDGEHKAGLGGEILVKVDDLRTAAGLFDVRERRDRDRLFCQCHQQRIGDVHQFPVVGADDLRHAELERTLSIAVGQRQRHARAVVQPLVGGVDRALRRHAHLVGAEGKGAARSVAHLRRKAVVEDRFGAFDLDREG